MSQAGYTPIQLYYSTTAAAVPVNTNLANGELAINITDGKLYYKDNGGTVRLLASNATSAPVLTFSAGTTGFTPSSATSGAVTLAGTLNVVNGGTGQTSYTDGQLLIGNTTGNTLTKATLTAGSGVTITNGAGSITINATGTGGDVVGPASATNNGIVLFDGTTGKIIKNSAASDGLIYGLTVGRGAGAVATNTAVGASALAANTSGAFNVAIGRLAATGNTTGQQNVAIGNAALYVNSTGSYISAVGEEALAANTTGSFNTAYGAFSLLNNTTASNNTAVGYQAGYTSTGQRNAFFGSEAGYANTTGESNTYIGRQAGYSMTSGNNNTIIGRYNGNQGGLDIRTASNYIVLSDGDGNPRMYSDNNGVLYDQNGKLRAVPQSGSSKTSSYTLATTDVGEYILLGASGAIVIPDATFSAGDVITIFNNTASTATITCSITTAYIAGTFTDKATMTLAAAGVATVLFITSTLCVVSGNVT